MIIRLAILDQNRDYMERLLDVYRARYTDRVEIADFSTLEQFLEGVERGSFDILLVDESIELDKNSLPGRGTLVRFTEEHYDCKEQPGICRYQSAERIYRDLLAIYVCNSDRELHSSTADGESAVVYAVTSPVGGAGTSSVAAAVALHLAAKQKRVVYLNLEPMGNPELYFQGEGREGLTQLIYDLKSTRSNLPLRIQSIMRRDPRGVEFIGAAENPMDLLELSGQEAEKLIQTLCIGQDALVVDIPFGFDEQPLSVLKAAARVLMVVDGSFDSCSKFSCIMEGLHMLNLDELSRKSALVCNRGANPEAFTGMQVLGRLPPYSSSDGRAVVKAISANPVFNQL